MAFKNNVANPFSYLQYLSYLSYRLHTGSISWNLRTKENIDIAYGVYLYVVESDYGVKKGKIAIIK